MLQREMRFTALALIDIISLLLSIAVGIGMALRGFKYWSLVAMAVTSTFLGSASFWADHRVDSGSAQQASGNPFHDAFRWHDHFEWPGRLHRL